MLLSYGTRNCWGFNDRMEIDMRVGKKPSVSIAFPSKRVVPAMCFEGANASGKTCGLRVLSFIYDFCLNSFQYAPNSQILYDTYFHNDDKSEFYITFCLNGETDTAYTYEAEIDKKKVYTEKLSKKHGRSKKILLERKDNNIIKNVLCSLQNGIIYKDTASFISTLLQYGVEEIKPFGEFFRQINSNVSYNFTRDDPMIDYVA